MKKLLLASLATAALASTAAFGADMAVKAPVYKAPPPPVTSWTGCYIDGGGGYGLWNQQHTTSTTFAGLPGVTISQTDGGRGWLGRVGGGCDYQVAPKWVLGILGDYDFMDLTGTNSPLEVTGAAPIHPISADEKESSAWYVGGRLGYLITPSVLTYVDGGYTQTRFGAQTLTTNLGALSGAAYPAQRYNGWFLGGGTETSLADFIPGLPQGFFLRSEYRFSQYQRQGLGETFLGIPDGNVENTKPYVQTITTSLVWRFNWAGPVVARY